MTTQKTSNLYWACRNDDIDTVKKILPKLKLTNINLIESNGSTALHAASFYGHANIVRLLLQQGAQTDIRNKYDKTAEEEASTDEVRAAFKSSSQTGATDDDDDIPHSEFVALYPNSEGKNKSELATNILKIRWGIHQAHKYTIAAASNLEHLEKQYRKKCEEKENESLCDARNRGKKLFEKYRETGNFDCMIELYLMETPFYLLVQKDETFLIDMYKHLVRYDKYIFQGFAYRGVSFFTEDFEPYYWALKHSKCLLEFCKVTGASKKRDYALRYMYHPQDDRQPVLFEIEFAEGCFSAIDAVSFSDFPDEDEVLILSGTFFEVTQIRKDKSDATIISLKNVPVNKAVVLTLIQ
ncbi:unnamed protein product [Adineta steineri]|uniref:Uncharacterized protein n=1 Tax=Adineta steineri TaxID=433720 RepID=A0A816AM17_9BILA|nr:unnamed protein product [Adineta steineri]CAF1599344.1 unnamed protein product [Adineta steineri]